MGAYLDFERLDNYEDRCELKDYLRRAISENKCTQKAYVYVIALHALNNNYQISESDFDFCKEAAEHFQNLLIPYRNEEDTYVESQIRRIFEKACVVWETREYYPVDEYFGPDE
jgi:hypothetical protein